MSGFTWLADQCKIDGHTITHEFCRRRQNTLKTQSLLVVGCLYDEANSKSNVNNDDDDDDGRQSISMMLSLAYNHFLSSYHQRNVCPRGKVVVLKTRTSNMKTQINTAMELLSVKY